MLAGAAPEVDVTWFAAWHRGTRAANARTHQAPRHHSPEDVHSPPGRLRASRGKTFEVIASDFEVPQSARSVRQIPLIVARLPP